MSVKSELRKARVFISAVILGPVYFLPSLLLLALRIEFVWTRLPDRIGHLAIDIDSYLKDMRLGRRPWARPIFLQSPEKSANPFFLDYWRKYLHIVSNPIARALLYPFMLFPYLVADLRDYVTVRTKVAKSNATYAAWADRPPLLKLEKEHEARGEAVLRELGIPVDAWFVCIHSRDAGYAAHDDHVNAHRNCSIETYNLAAEEIVSRGGWCVRVGDPSAPPLTPMPQVIDYPRTSFRSDWMDVFLCARCRFFLGSSSGLFLISTVFGVPSALAHITPMGCAYAFTPNDLTIPKLIAGPSGMPMNIREVFRSPVASLRFTYEFDAAGVSHIDNTAEEIRGLTVEMIERLENRAFYSEEDERLQREFRSLLQPDHYSYGAAGRIGRDLLRRHANLLENPQVAPIN